MATDLHASADVDPVGWTHCWRCDRLRLWMWEGELLRLDPALRAERYCEGDHVGGASAGGMASEQQPKPAQSQPCARRARAVNRWDRGPSLWAPVLAPSRPSCGERSHTDRTAETPWCRWQGRRYWSESNTLQSRGELKRSSPKCSHARSRSNRGRSSRRAWPLARSNRLTSELRSFRDPNLSTTSTSKP